MPAHMQHHRCLGSPTARIQRHILGHAGISHHTQNDSSLRAAGQSDVAPFVSHVRSGRDREGPSAYLLFSEHGWPRVVSA